MRTVDVLFPIPDEWLTAFNTTHGRLQINNAGDLPVLQKIRTVRQKQSGLDHTYSDFKKVFDEVEFIWDLCKRNRSWKVIDTTNKSIEETAWEIIHHIHGGEHEE